MTTVFVPAPLRHLTGGMERVEVVLPDDRPNTVRVVLSELEKRYPGLEAELLVEGELTPYLAVFIDGEQAGMGLQARVGNEEEVFFLAPVAGGAC